MAVQRLMRTYSALGLVLSLSLATGTALSQPVPVARAIAYPGMRAILPTSGTAVEACYAPASGPADPLRLAVLVREPSGFCRLICGRRRGEEMVKELDLAEKTAGVLSLELSRARPDGGAALAVHWASASREHGKLQVWALVPGVPELALETSAEAFYFTTESDASSVLVAYEPERDSAVRLPSVFEWQDKRLVRSRLLPHPLAARLMADFDEVLVAFEASHGDAPVNRMVIDVALSKARLHEASGDLGAARAAYRRTAELAAALPEDASDRAEIGERAAEAERRLKALP